MTTFKIDSSWNQIKGKLKQKFGQLTDDDLTFVDGKGDELLGRLQEKLGLSADDLNHLLDGLKRDASAAAAEGLNKFEALQANAGRIADDVKERASAAVDDLKQAASARAEEFRGQAEEVYGQARQRAQSLREDGEEYVRGNPRQALLTAVAIGFVAGLLIRR